MPVPLNLLRFVLGLLCIFFAYSLGRTAARLSKGVQKRSRVYGWGIRTAIAAAALLWRRGFDSTAVIMLLLAILAGGWGWWDEWRPKRHAGQN